MNKETFIPFPLPEPKPIPIPKPRPYEIFHKNQKPEQEQVREFREYLAKAGKSNFFLHESIIYRRIFKKLNIKDDTKKQIAFIENNGEAVRRYTQKIRNG